MFMWFGKITRPGIRRFSINSTSNKRATRPSEWDFRLEGERIPTGRPSPFVASSFDVRAREGAMKRASPVIAVFGFLLFAQSTQAGWTPVKRLTWTPGESNNPAIAVDSSAKVHVFWSDNTPGYPGIYYKRSTNAGLSWAPALRLTGTVGTSTRPAIAVDSSDGLHLVWSCDAPGNAEIYYGKSTDEGATWTRGRRLTWNSGNSSAPAIAVDSSGSIHVVWEDDNSGTGEIYYQKSTDGGETWTSKKRLTWNPGLSYEPAISVDASGNPQIAWVDGMTGNWEIYFRKGAGGGSTWPTSRRLSDTSGGSYAPSMAAYSAGNIQVFWSDDTPGNYEVYQTRTTDGGASWTISQRMTWTSGESWWPANAFDSSNGLHLVWYDATPGNFEIYYGKSTDGGAVWTKARRITWTSGYSADPAVAADPAANLHVVWMDDTPGNNEIYYRKFVQ